MLKEKYFSKDDLKSLSTSIAEAEKNTSGEIRVVVRHHRQWKERKLALRDLALKEFYSLGMQNTRDRTGVLILLLLSEHKFQILADQGINEKVEEGTWDRIAEKMTHYFKDGKFTVGLNEAVSAVGVELSQHFPRKADDTDELPNEVVEH